MLLCKPSHYGLFCEWQNHKREYFCAFISKLPYCFTTLICSYTSSRAFASAVALTFVFSVLCFFNSNHLFNYYRFRIFVFPYFINIHTSYSYCCFVIQLYFNFWTVIDGYFFVFMILLLYCSYFY